MHIRRADALGKGLRDACPHGFSGNLFFHLTRCTAACISLAASEVFIPEPGIHRRIFETLFISMYARGVCLLISRIASANCRLRLRGHPGLPEYVVAQSAPFLFA